MGREEEKQRGETKTHYAIAKSLLLPLHLLILHFLPLHLLLRFQLQLRLRLPSPPGPLGAKGGINNEVHLLPLPHAKPEPEHQPLDNVLRLRPRQILRICVPNPREHVPKVLYKGVYFQIVCVRFAGGGAVIDGDVQDAYGRTELVIVRVVVDFEGRTRL